MSRRTTIFAPGEIYHIFNRSIARQPIFNSTRNNERALDLLSYYQRANPPLRYSHFNRLTQDAQNLYKQKLTLLPKHVSIFSFCLMPNHFHLLVKELLPNGIKTFMSNFQNGYAKYINLKENRSGSLFQAMFKAVLIETDEQFTHVGRYIHINPLTSFILRNSEELYTYRWSSFADYNSDANLFIDKNFMLEMFPSLKKFNEFTLDQVEYQRDLELIKHLTLEEVP